MTDLVLAAEQIADALTECLEDDQRIGYLDVLDALGICRLTLTEDDHQASEAYVQAADLEKSLPLPERYWPRNGTDVTWCPDVLRSWLEMHRRAGAGNPDPTISAGVALFLLDHWEATRDAE